jgi:DNA-binding response OmpR family regulator
MKTIIIQDRSREICELLTIILGLEGYYVLAFERCDIVNFNPVAVILEYNRNSDLVTSVIKDIKEDTNHIPILGIMFDVINNEKLCSLGFDDFILKPFDNDTLLNTVAKSIKNLNISNLSEVLK